ncbi:MAG: Glu-tRNA(Gln) amidotransferase subunit GatE [Candidatus Coatesbacteria bacterium]|nr:Glu-tRNA(Gln) amidotransferase subunit GatE [Candidatus Coatesbacteria bacterium]
MENINYEKIGFQAGLEIHQQLLTDLKLFCHCPSYITNEKCDAEIVRHMRPTLSELGEYDGTALMEFKTKKRITYQLYHKYTCTYEMDDTPPFLLNQQALDIALEIAVLLGCSIVDEIHIIRKQYLDGSIPTGFQRTAIIGVEGSIPYRNKNIRIIQLGLEEDSCREVKDVGHDIVFKTDRLGIPLIETVTYPDMLTPKEAGEVAALIGDIVRVTQKVRRGIGSVRQDVNVSVNGGTRVEIKGVPRVGLIPELTHNEAIRQVNLLSIRDKLLSTGINSIAFQTFNIPPNLRKANGFKIFFKEDDSVKGIKLNGLKETLEKPTQPGLRFRDELSGRVKVIACLDRKPNIMTEADLRSYNITEDVIKQLKELMQISDRDGFVIIWGPKTDVETGINEIVIRCEELLKGIPRETRQALNNGNTDFERILPGPDRMYPDTDLPPTVISEERLNRIITNLPELPWARRKYLRDLRLPNHMVDLLVCSIWMPVFKKIVEELDINPILVGVVITEMLKNLKRKGYDTKNITSEMLFNIFASYKEKAFSKEAIPLILLEFCQKNLTLKTVLDNLGIQIVSINLVKIIIKDILDNDTRNYKGDNRKKLDHLMGEVMQKVRGRIDGSIVYRLLEGAIYT